MEKVKIIRGTVETVKRLPDSAYGKQYMFQIRRDVDGSIIEFPTRAESVFGYLRIEFGARYEFALLQGQLVATTIDESY